MELLEPAVLLSYVRAVNIALSTPYVTTVNVNSKTEYRWRAGPVRRRS
jgi:hypothetical protein